MNISSIVFDAVAEIIAAEERGESRELLLSFSSVVAALCLDTGLDEAQISAELSSRVTRIHAHTGYLRLIADGLDSSSR